MLSKTLGRSGNNSFRLRALDSLLRDKNILNVPIHIQMIICNYSCLVKDSMPSSWRKAIQRPLWQEKETKLEVLTMKPVLFVSRSKLCKDGIVYSRAPCFLVDLKRLIEESQRIQEWKRWNTEHIYSLNFRNRNRSQRMITFSYVFCFFFPPFLWRYSAKKQDYSSGTQRENAWRHWYKMKPDRRYSAASSPGLIIEGHPFLCSVLLSFTCFSPCVTSSFHVQLSLYFLCSPSRFSLHFSAHFSLLF